MTKQEKSEQMLYIAEQCLKSDLSQVAYAREHELRIQTLRYWVKRYRIQQKQSGSFIQLQDFNAGGLHLRYPNGVELTVRPIPPCQC